jgi:hypothetical protein
MGEREAGRTVGPKRNPKHVARHDRTPVRAADRDHLRPQDLEAAPEQHHDHALVVECRELRRKERGNLIGSSRDLEGFRAPKRAGDSEFIRAALALRAWHERSP